MSAKAGVQKRGGPHAVPTRRQGRLRPNRGPTFFSPRCSPSLYAEALCSWQLLAVQLYLRLVVLRQELLLTGPSAPPPCCSALVCALCEIGG